MNQQRKLSFDMIRIVAVSMVVMIHVSAYVVTYFTRDGQCDLCGRQYL